MLEGLSRMGSPHLPGAGVELPHPWREWGRGGKTLKGPCSCTEGWVLPMHLRQGAVGNVAARVIWAQVCAQTHS